LVVEKESCQEFRGLFATNHTALIYELGTRAHMPYSEFFTSLPPVVHSTGHLFANSQLSTVDTSLVALTQVLMTVLHHITHTTLHNSTATVISLRHSSPHIHIHTHTHTLASLHLTLLCLDSCLICHVSQFSNNLLLSCWPILEHCGRVCLSFQRGLA
jgi:hypothetical protein